MSVTDKDVFFTKFLPISSTLAFDNTGLTYDVSRIIVNGTFDQAAYEAYSPAFIPVTLALAYAISFASITGVFVHTFRMSHLSVISCCHV